MIIKKKYRFKFCFDIGISKLAFLVLHSCRLKTKSCQAKDYYIDGENTQLIYLFLNFNWGREKDTPNYTPGVDFLDHDLL